MSAADAVLLDVGGIFFGPEHERIRGAFERAELTTTVDLDEAHYRAARAFTTDLDVEADWDGCWLRYLDDYITACGVAEDAERADLHRHLDSEFADAGLWCQVLPGAKEGLQALADTGVKLGIVSNADGLIESRLREAEILQVGPGLGVEVSSVIDSGAVGVMKPDPRIFTIALDALDVAAERAWYVGDMPGIDVVGARRAGLRPFVMDPLGLHTDADYDRTGSLHELAGLI